MAISKSIILKSGLSVENVYNRIDSLTGNKDGMNYTIKTYISQEAFNSNKECIEEETLYFLPSVEENSANFIKQAYEDAKTKDKYINGIDC